jgi:hypothetical protein
VFYIKRRRVGAAAGDHRAREAEALGYGCEERQGYADLHHRDRSLSTTGKDSVVDLATGWLESEFNIFGDGDGSEAVFNTGSSITVRVALTDGSTTAATCEADAGTTGETNNLTLKSCSGESAAMPFIRFIESN